MKGRKRFWIAAIALIIVGVLTTLGMLPIYMPSAYLIYPGIFLIDP